MKILYATDLHGDKKKYEKIFEIANKRHINTIVNGGDILPKWGERYSIQNKFLNEYLPEYFRRLNTKNINYLVMMGNDDLEAYDLKFNNLCSRFPNIFNINKNKVTINDYEFIGLNNILDTPFACKDRIVNEEAYHPEKQFHCEQFKSTREGYQIIPDWENERKNLPLMKDILNSLPKPNNQDRSIFVTHEPPKHLDLAYAYNVDHDLGSEDIYQFIKKNQPLFTLHGHLHESPIVGGFYYNQLGKTICIQRFH